MGLLRFLAFGAAVAVGVNYLTKKRPDGTSVLDDITARAPEWMDKAKEFTEQVKNRYASTGNEQESKFGQASAEQTSSSQSYTTGV